MVMTILPARSSDLRALAVGCLYVLTGNAMLDWPGSGRSKPSLRVVVNHRPGRLFQRGHATYFPFWVRWDLWHHGVVPVLLNEDVQTYVATNLSLRVEQNAVLLHLKDFETYIEKLIAYLTDSFIDAGYLPEAMRVFSDPEPIEPDPLCEPIERNPLGFPRDPVLQYPDGTSRLTYNVVDE